MDFQHKFAHKRISGTRHKVQVLVTVPDTYLMYYGAKQLNKDLEELFEKVIQENGYEKLREVFLEGQMNFASHGTDVVLTGYADRVSKKNESKEPVGCN